MSAADQPPASSPAVAPEFEEETNRVQENATEGLEETMPDFEETTEETGTETRRSGDRVETAAVITVVAVLAAACGWSAIALHGLAQQSGVTSWLAWGAPIIVDGPLFQSAIALVVLERRAQNGAPVNWPHKRFFWLTLAMSELVSLIGNGAHAAKIEVTPLISAVIAGAAPIAAMAVMHGFTILIKVPRTGNGEQVSRANDVKTARVLTPPAPAGDGQSSPVVSYPSPVGRLETPEETPPVSCPSPGDAGQETTGAAMSPQERDAAVWALHLERKSLREIAEITDLSKSYVGKVVARLKAENGAADSEPADQNEAGVVLKFSR